MTEKLIAVLEQKSRLKPTHKFELRESGILAAEYTGRGQKQEVTHHVGRLDPDALHDRMRASAMLVGVAIFAFFAGLMIVAALLPHSPSAARITFLAIAFFLGFFGLICWIEFAKQSYDVIVFNDHFTGKRVVIHADIPSREQVDAFVAKLRSAMQSHRQQFTPPATALPDQIRQLATLKEEGLLTEEEFARSKQNLIKSARAAGPIGFTG